MPRARAISLLRSNRIECLPGSSGCGCPGLAIERLVAGGRLDPHITAVAMLLPAVHCIAELGEEHIAVDTLAELGGQNRKQDLDSRIQVAGHEVGAAAIDLRLAAVVEVI